MNPLRSSSYNIYIELDKNKKLLVHGYTGHYMEVSQQLSGFLLNQYENFSNEYFIKKFYDDNNPLYAEELLSKLKRSGFITVKTSEAEEKFLIHVAQNLAQNSYPNLVYYYILLTYDCNLKCTYCYQKNIDSKLKKYSRNQSISTTMIDDIFKSFPEIEKNINPGNSSLARNFTLYGGEPLMQRNREPVEYIIKKIKLENGKFINAVSNGVDLDYYEDLLGPGKIESLQVTLDGVSDINNGRRVNKTSKDSFRRTVKNIDMALSRGTRIRLRINLDERNLKYYSELAEKVYEKGWHKYKGFSVWAAPVAVYHDHESFNSCFSNGKLFIDMDRDSLKNSKISEIGTFQNGLSKAIKKNFKSNSPLLNIFRPAFCSSPRNLYLFDMFGNIFPCTETVGYENQRIAVINQEGSLGFNSNYDLWKGRIISSVEPCSSCTYSLFCGGGCAVKAKGHNGSMYKAYCDGFKEYFDLIIRRTYLEVKNKINKKTEVPFPKVSLK